MRILHIAPHLGGGVGKAHAAIAAALPRNIEQTFLLLEDARDRTYVDRIEASGARIMTARDADHVAQSAAAADIVQFEFWNHPRLFECLARTNFPPMRTVFWSHISGISKPVIQPSLIEHAGRFVFTTGASRGSRSVAMLSEAARRRLAVINSGFAIADVPLRPRRSEAPVIAYLGTVDFVKMHPGFFDAVDMLHGDVRARVWGRFDPESPVAARARAMRHPGRIDFCGHAAEPAQALAGADIFFYPLQRDHYGTAENALIEAMSLGLPPVVLNNPSELAIVHDGATGLVARSVEECTQLLERLLRSPQLRETIGRNAARYVAETRTPERSARQFMDLWRELLLEPPRVANFRTIVGDDPADWFLATQCLPGEEWRPSAFSDESSPTKGKLAHFESAFPHDPSLARLAAFRRCEAPGWR
jgi:glycosyltransferase involved in cell wall biosynthesis